MIINKNTKTINNNNKAQKHILLVINKKQKILKIIQHKKHILIIMSKTQKQLIRIIIYKNI